MTEQEIYSLSCYRQVAMLDKEHNITLVQHTVSSKIFVKKILSAYNIKVYQYLIEHPVDNTPKIYEAIEDNGKLIIIEDYYNGNTLQEYLDDNGPLAEDMARNIIIRLCRIVRDLHNASPPIIHRDIKPSNIIINDSCDVKLLDMNAARQVSGDKASDTALLGTAGYAAPEQFGFSETDERTDVYAIGVLLNVMLTCQIPKEHMAGGSMGRIIKKCTQIDPVNRYPSIGALLTALGVNEFEERAADKNRVYHKFLPPGFRSLNPPFMIAAVLCYILIFYIGITLKINRDISDTELFLYRLCTTVMLVFMVLFSGNYLNIQNKLPLTRSSSTVTRIIGIILGNIILFLLTILLLGTLMIIFVR